MLPAVIKNPLKLRVNDELVQERAKGSERRHVGDEIVHFGPAFGKSAKEMFVMPNAIRANPLFVDEAMWRIDLHDLG